MANHTWRGDALVVNQVDTIVPSGTWVTGDEITLTINGRALIVTVGSAVGNTDIANIINASWNASDSTTGLLGSESRNFGGDEIPEFSEITSSVAVETVSLTGDDQKPFTLAVAENSSAGSLTHSASATAAKGPNHLIAENFDSGSLPSAGDTVYIQSGSTSILYGLSALASVAVDNVFIFAGYTGFIGLPRVNLDNAADYIEYRQRYLRCPVNVEVRVGSGSGSSSGRIQLDFVAATTKLIVFGTGSSVEPDRYALQIKGGDLVAGEAYIFSGEVDFAPDGADTAAFDQTTVSGSATLRCSAGCSFDKLNVEGSSTVSTDSNVADAKVRDTATWHKGSGAVTAVDVQGGTLSLMGTGTVTTLNLGSATVDASGLLEAVTITSTNIRSSGFTWSDPQAKLTTTNPIATSSVSIASGSFDPGPGRTVDIT